MFVIFGLVDVGFLIPTGSAPRWPYVALPVMVPLAGKAGCALAAGTPIASACKKAAAQCLV